MNPSDNIMLITFDRTNASGPYGINPRDKKNVYPDSRCDTKVQLGDRWFCILTLNSNLMASNYFATPLYKVDPVFLFMLDEGSKMEIVRFACENHPDIVKGMVPEVHLTPKVEEKPTEAVPQVIVKRVLAEKPSLKDKVWYLGENRLGSSIFKDGRYSVCRSLNGKRLQVYPDRFGNLECEHNEIAISGLDEIMGFEPRELRFDSVRGMVLITV